GRVRDDAWAGGRGQAYSRTASVQRPVGVWRISSGGQPPEKSHQFPRGSRPFVATWTPRKLLPTIARAYQTATRDAVLRSLTGTITSLVTPIRARLTASTPAASRRAT